MPPASPPTLDNAGKRLRRVWSYFGRSWGIWLVVILATLIVAASEPVLPALLKPILDDGFGPGTFNPWLVPPIIIVLFIVRGLGSYIADMGLRKISTDGIEQMRLDMFNRLMQAQPSVFSRQSASALTNTIVHEATTGSRLLVDTLMKASRNALTVIALLAYLLYLNWRLTLTVGVLFPVIAWVIKKVSVRLYRLSINNKQATDKLAYVVEENVLAHRDVRLNDAQGVQTKRFERLTQTLRRLNVKSTAASSAVTPITQLLAAIALSAVITMALLQSTSGATTVGSFVAFITAMLMLLTPMKALTGVSNHIARGLASLERVMDLIETTPIETGGSHRPAGGEGKGYGRARGDIRFEQVSVTYPGAARPAIDGFDLAIRPGETVALVGASGAGKTTLVNLLPRFAEPGSGRVLLDGVSLPEWDLAALRAQFAFVSQHVVMLNESIAGNVALGDEEPDEARVLQSLQAANLGDWVAQLPQGIQTEVGHNAAQLSGGQRQRLAIARAIYKDAPILILDEATSALDNESERAVQQALERLMANRTTIVIAHRLSTVQHADRIVAMDAGRIAEIGTHEELLARDGLYAKLYRLGLREPDEPAAV